MNTKRLIGAFIAAFIFAFLFEWLLHGVILKGTPAPIMAMSTSGVATSRQDRPNVLALAGEIDLHVLPTVMTSLNEMIAKRPNQLIVDLSGVPYVDSVGVAAIINAMQTVEAYGGKFALAGLQETVRSILEISRLDHIFSIFPDVDAALAAA